MKNIDLFNRFTAEIFLRLYESFPRPVPLSEDGIAEKVLGEEQSWEPDVTQRVLGKEDFRAKNIHAFGLRIDCSSNH